MSLNKAKYRTNKALVGTRERSNIFCFHRYDHGEDGLSLVYVLIATLALITGSATLLNRTSSSLFGSVFQGQGMRARDTARLGMSYLISEINKERNRHLLAVLDSQVDSERTIWTDTSASQFHSNPCLTRRDSAGNRIAPPSPALNNLNLGESATNGGLLYIQADGTISKTRGTATRAFKIVTDNPNNNFRLARKTNLFLLDDERTRGAFRLSVEGITYKGNTNNIESRAILQEDFSVIPKCCKVPFGGYNDPNTWQPRGHGTNTYQITNRSNLSSNSCMLPGLNPNGFGIVIGASGEGGALNSSGNPLIQDSSGTTVNPIYCISSLSTQCTPSSNTSRNEMEKMDVALPPPPSWPGNISGPIPNLVACSTDNACPSNFSGQSGNTSQLTYYDSGTRATIFNAANVSQDKLPSNCVIERGDIHCIYNSFTLGGDKFIFLSGNNTRLIRLYFPNAGTVIDQTGNGTYDHCKISPSECQMPTNITNFSIFGCNKKDNSNCDQQLFKIKGAVSGAGMYIYAPEATIDFTGNAKFYGVLWVKSINMTGNAYPVVPTSGVADVFVLMGILPGESNNYDQSLTGDPTTTDLFAWDMVARSTNRFRFFGN